MATFEGSNGVFRQYGKSVIWLIIATLRSVIIIFVVCRSGDDALCDQLWRVQVDDGGECWMVDWWPRDENNLEAWTGRPPATSQPQPVRSGARGFHKL